MNKNLMDDKQRIEDLEIKIEAAESEMAALKVRLHHLKSERDVLKKPMDLARKIASYEKRYPNNFEWTLESLVRIGETLEEWVSRFARFANGAKDPVWVERYYKDLGYTSGYYVKWLIEADDPRVIGTEVYQRMKGAGE